MGEVMIRLASLAKQYEQAFYAAYQHRMGSEHNQAIKALIHCRTPACGEMQYYCKPCDKQQLFCHSCGHRTCPQCQHRANSQWLARQQQKLLPVNYSMVTFTLPYELRKLVWQNQKITYAALFNAAIETLNRFAINDKQLRGQLGMTVVLHTHSRRLEYHPHLHVLIPAGTINLTRTLWREKSSAYLFNGRALSVVFRATFLAHIKMQKLNFPELLPKKWVVQCQSVGRGEPALKYLSRYLYRGVITEKNILKHHNGNVTFQYKDNQTNAWKTRTVSGVKFLWLVLQHVLPKGFRRTRDYGFLHGNAKPLLRKIQLVLKVALEHLRPPDKSEHLCPCCHNQMIFTPFIKRPRFGFYRTS